VPRISTAVSRGASPNAVHSMLLAGARCSVRFRLDLSIRRCLVRRQCRAGVHGTAPWI